MMDEVGLLCAIEPGNFGDRVPGADKPVAAPAPSDRAQTEPLFANPITVRTHPGRYCNLKTSRARGAGHRQAMGAKIPVLGDEEEELRPAPRARR